MIVDIIALEGPELTVTHETHPKWPDNASRTEAGWTKMLGVFGNMLSATFG